MNKQKSDVDTGKKYKIAKDYITDGMKVNTHSSFSDNINSLFARIKPRRIIETGTYLGTGTTTIIAKALKCLNIKDAVFYTIEVNPEYHARAKKYLSENNFKVYALNGLSVPRKMLPSREEIERRTIKDVEYGDIFVDHDEENRVQMYYNETNFAEVEDDLLGRCLKAFEYKPDFVLLDSAGHMGNIEFDYLIENLNGQCYIALDDIHHIKHYRDFKKMQTDKRFEIIVQSDEKFGFCIAKFTPAQDKVLKTIISSPVVGNPTKVLIVRPDSIGDFVIFSGVMQYFKQIYPNAHITLLVQKTVTDLAQSCPFVDEVIAFDRNSAESDQKYLISLIQKLRERQFDVAINPVCSRTGLDDLIVIKSGAKERIAFSGDCANTDVGLKLLNDTYYDRVIPSTNGPLIETKRNEEFIRGLCDSIEDVSCKPVVWLKQQDKDYIDNLLNELNVKNPIIVCPFAQARYREWPMHKWAQLLSNYREIPVLICGSGKDENQANLLIDSSGHPNIHNICGKTNLRQLAALFSKSRLCVASESGTAHIAAAVDCPQVVIIGGGHFGRFMPYSPTTTLVHLDMVCFNCNWKCPHWRWEIYCISQVSVTTVRKAVNAVLSKPFVAEPRIFIDDIKPAVDKIPNLPTLLLGDNVSGKPDKAARCWCGGGLNESVHPLYGLCKDCGTLVLKNKPVKKYLQKLYSLDGYWHKQMNINGYQHIEQRAISDFGDRIPAWYEMLIKHKAMPENLLEIGCGHGGFLHYCRQRGVKNVVGIEVDKKVCKYARDYFNLADIVCGLFPDVRIPFDKFDAVVGFDVLEHFTDPVGALRKVRELLADHGICLFQIPHYRGEGVDWVQFRPGEHIYLFNNESVRRLFEAAGLEIDEVTAGYFADDIFVVARPKKTAGAAVSVNRKDINKQTDEFLVTAIVSTYNSQDCIAHCLEDLEQQSIADKLEIIVVDSGSSQDEGAIVRAFQQKYKNIKYIRTQNRETIYKAWNRAIRMASGKYITNANTDDSHTPDALEKLARALDAHPDAVLAYADQGCVEEIDAKPLKNFIAGEYSRYRMLADWCYISSHPMWRKDVHKEFGYFDETFIAAGDWEFWLRISQKYDFVYINEILGNRRWTEDCLSKKSFTEGIATYEAELIRKCYHYALETGLVVDYRGISANPVFASWPDVNWWKQKVQDKLYGTVFNAKSNIKNIYENRKSLNPQLSIVIVSNNNLPALQAGLISLNNQTENSFEVIVVNNGQIISQPLKIAEQLQYDFCCVELKRNLGPSVARNTGILQSKGKYVAFLDDETVAEKNFVKNILKHFGSYEIHGLRGRILPKEGAKLRYIPPEFDLGEDVIFTACQIGTNCAFRRDILTKVGGFNENLFGCEFEELSYRIFKEDGENINGILYFPDVVIYHNPPASAFSHYINQMQQRISRRLAGYKWPNIDSYIKLAQSQHPNRYEAIEKNYTQLLNMASLLQNRHPQLSLKWIEKAVSLNPEGIAGRYALGTLYLRLEKYNQAQGILENILGPLEKVLANSCEEFSNLSKNNLSQIAYCYISACTGLAQCYMKHGQYGKVKQVYANILNKPYLSIPPQQKADILNVLKKLEKCFPAGVFAERQNLSAAPVLRNENNYLVSAIVSAYNSEKYLRDCLADLENQSIADKLEIIIVNSASEQDEESIVREFQKRYANIVYIKTDKREGIYSSWNRAIKAARGQFLTSANTDDRHRRDALEIMANTLLENPDIALVYGDQIITDTPNPTFENHNPIKIAQQPEFSRPRLLFGCCVGSQPMWRKSLHEEFGDFDETLTCAGDWDFWLRVSSKYKFKHIPEVLGLYYQNPQGIEHGNKIHSLYERYIVGKRYGNPYISIIQPFTTADNPLISICMAAYNSQDYIAQAIESVLIQNYRNFELLIVDDGSTDHTADVVNRFKDEHIKYFRKEHGGPSSARNLALQKSNGSFVVILDSDDMITSNFIAKHLIEFQQHPEADLVYCDDLLIDENNKPVRIINRPEYQDSRTLISELFHCGFPVVPFRTSIRKDVFDKIGRYDEQLLVAEDYDMLRRFIKHGLKIHHLPAALYLRRIRTKSHSRNFEPDKAKCQLEVVRRFTDTFTPEQLFPDVQWEQLSANQKLLLAKCKAARVYMKLGEQYLNNNIPDYASLSFAAGFAELYQCHQLEPTNQHIKILMEQCLSERDRIKATTHLVNS